MSASLDLARVREAAEEAQRYALLLERTDLDDDTRRAHTTKLRALCSTGESGFRFAREGIR